MSVIVTNASSVKALVVTRSLGRKGIHVVTTDSERVSPTFFSRYSKEYFLTPSAEKEPVKFIEFLLRYANQRKNEMIIPTNSTETLLIAKYKNRFSKFTKIPLDNYSKMIRLHDKERLFDIATQLGISVPKTYSLRDISEINKIAAKLEFPVVIKLKSATSSKGISYAYSKDELIQKYKQTVINFDLDKKSLPIIQEYILGTGYGVSTLLNYGELRAIFVHRRLREYPLSGGPSTVRMSTRHPKMEKIAIKLLREMGWYGLAMVEFKMDERTKKPYLLEVNPRVWGSINLAVSAGVDFPYLLYKMVMEGDIKPVTTYKLNVKAKYLMNDLRAIASLIIQGKFKQVRNEMIVDSIDEIARDDILPALVFPILGVKEFITDFTVR